MGGWRGGGSYVFEICVLWLSFIVEKKKEKKKREKGVFCQRGSIVILLASL